MLQSRELHIYPNSRAIKQALEKSRTKEQVLPTFIAINDFFKKIIIIKDKKLISDEIKIIFLHKACDFDEFKLLHIPQDFISFFSNSDIIFSFLNELAQEKIDIEKVLSITTDEKEKIYIDTLQKIQKNYIDILEKEGYYDIMTLPYIYEINIPFIKNFDNIIFYQPPYFPKFKEEIIDKVKNIAKVEFENDLNTKQFSKITISSFSQQIFQIAYIKQKVYYFIQKGYLPEKIAIILPDKELAKNLKNFDSENNFYLTFGNSFSNSYIFKKLSAIYQYLLDKSIENRYRVSKFFGQELEDNFTLINKNIMEFLETLVNDEQDSQENIIYHEELSNLKTIFKYIEDYSSIEIIHLFLKKLENRVIEDKRESKIKIYDISKTIGIDFDAVIIVDFNEEKIPKKIKNDIFLPTKIREKIGLQTILEKQRDEKKIYKNLIYNAKEVAISYVDNEQNRKSRFLDELSLKYIKENFNPKKLSKLFFNSTVQKNQNNVEIVAYHDLTKVRLSASKLKIFLTCKRRYYYHYIKNIKEYPFPTDEITNQDIGNTLHEVLEEVYSEKKYFYDDKELFKLIETLLYKRVKNPVEKFYIDLWLKRLPKFAMQEVKRFRDGFKVFKVEKGLSTEYKGFKLYGKIDRIDIKDNQLYVLDYKTGKIPSTKKREIEEKSVSDFQLQFYYLLSSTLQDTYLAYYYDLENAKLVEEEFFDEKLAILDEILAQLTEEKEIEFSKTEDEKRCIYCPYKLICGRVF